MPHRELDLPLGAVLHELLRQQRFVHHKSLQLLELLNRAEQKGTRVGRAEWPVKGSLHGS